jgi:prepilin-type N-terminal cleavage/methylation domain-containing protein/prepilin-type processing-associated H-X9-DG protein
MVRIAVKSRLCRGFTLIEMLVVIVIMAILGSLLLASVVRAMTLAKIAACKSNLEQLARANLTYAGDHEGSYCPAQEPMNLVRWHGARTGVGSAFDASKGFLSPYLGESQIVKADPLFTGYISGSSSFEDGSGGYGYNEIYIGGTPQNNFVPATVLQVPHPERTVMFTTTALASGNGIQEYPFCEAPQWVDPSNQLSGSLQPSVHFRALGKAVVAWCDGHVTEESPSVLGGDDYYGGNSAKEKIGWFGPTDNNGFWNPNYQGTLDAPTVPISPGD